MKIVKVLICAVVVSFLFSITTTVKAAGLLTGLEVEGIGSLSVSTKNSWNLGFSTSYDYVTITATAAEGVTVTGDGQVPIKEGANSIVVTATNGTQTDTYTINLNVTKKAGGSGAVVDPKDGTVSYDKDATDIKNPETGAFMNCSLIAFAIGSSLFTLIKLRKKTRFYNI